MAQPLGCIGEYHIAPYQKDSPPFFGVASSAFVLVFLFLSRRYFCWRIETEGICWLTDQDGIK